MRLDMTTQMPSVARLGVPMLADDELNEEDRKLLRRMLQMPHRKDRRKSLMATARSDIPIMPELLTNCIAHASYLQGGTRQDKERTLEAIVDQALACYEQVVFPRDRFVHRTLLRGCVFVRSLVTGYVEHLCQLALTQQGIGARDIRSRREWVLSLLLPAEQRLVFRSGEKNYEELIISDHPCISG